MRYLDVADTCGYPRSKEDDDAKSDVRRAPGERGPRVLVLTTFDLDEYVFEALRAGADGLMLKGSPPRQLAEAVRTVAPEEALLAPTVTKRLIERYVSRPPTDTVKQERFAELTERELEVLQLLTRGLPNVEIGQLLSLRRSRFLVPTSAGLRPLPVRWWLPVRVPAERG